MKIFPRDTHPLVVLRVVLNTCEDSKTYKVAVKNKKHSRWRRTVDAAIEYLAERGAP